MSSTVLVVEDNPTLRMIIADALNMLPVNVIECSSAEEALHELKKPTRFGLVLTDIRMPGAIDGLGLARIIWVTWPHLPVVLTSGHCVLNQEQLPEHSTFMAKPWSLDLLFQTVRARLA